MISILVKISPMCLQANAIVAFKASAWRCTNSRYDHYFEYMSQGRDPKLVASPNEIEGS